MTKARNVLIVDDEGAIRSLLCEALARSGFTALEAADGQQALAVAREFPQKICALVSDVVMPGMSGLELARSLGMERPGIKVVLISGFTDQLPAMEPEWEFVRKPFSVARLCDVVARMCGTGARGGLNPSGPMA